MCCDPPNRSHAFQAVLVRLVVWLRNGPLLCFPQGIAALSFICRQWAALMPCWLKGEWVHTHGHGTVGHVAILFVPNPIHNHWCLTGSTFDRSDSPRAAAAFWQSWLCERPMVLYAHK